MNNLKKPLGKPKFVAVIIYFLIFISLLSYIAYHITNKFSESLFQEKFIPFFVIASLAVFPIYLLVFRCLKSKKEGKPFYPSDSYKGLGWIAQGLIWGYTMLLLSGVLNNIVFDAEIIMDSRVFYIVPIWAITGLLVGYVSKLSYESKTITQEKKS